MANSKKDENRIPTLLGTSNADGSTPVLIKADSGAAGIMVDDGTGGSDLSGDIASRDDNFVPVAMVVSSSDGITPVALYADPSTGELLIKTT